MEKRKLKTTEAVFLIVAGLWLGTVFTFGMNHWNAPVTREDAVPVTAVYDHCLGGLESGEELLLRFADHEQLSIDCCCVTGELREQVNALQPGEELSALVHPNADTILELEADGELLMEFDDSVQRLSDEKVGFRFLGIFMYAMAIFGAVGLILNKINK